MSSEVRIVIKSSTLTTSFRYLPTRKGFRSSCCFLSLLLKKLRWMVRNVTDAVCWLPMQLPLLSQKLLLLHCRSGDVRLLFTHNKVKGCVDLFWRSVFCRLPTGTVVVAFPHSSFWLPQSGLPPNNNSPSIKKLSKNSSPP